MEFVSKEVPRDFNLFKVGDIHIGALHCHERGFLRFINAVQQPYAGVSENYVVCMGDQIEAIASDDYRFDLATLDLRKGRLEHQMDFFIEEMFPIRDKIITILEGNHEAKVVKAFDLTSYACRELNTKYGTYAAVVTFGDASGKILFKGFFTHGSGGISSTAEAPERQLANMKISLKRKLWAKAGDCALMAMGHTHRLIVAEPESRLYLTSDDERVYQNYTSVPQNAEFIPKDLRWYCNTGSFLRLYKKGVSGYAERAGYDPVELGYTVARVRNGLIEGVDRVRI